MIRNIIFDIGGVLLDYNPKTYLDKLNIEESKRKELNDIIFHNQKWRDCLNGFITNSELIEYLVKENLKYKNEIEQILSKYNLKYMLPPKQDMIEYYKNLKQKGYKIYLCSNITKDTYNYIKDNFEIIQISDGGVFSCFENISKPNAEIYHKLIGKYNLNMEESILIDDTKRNIISSNDIGLKGILFNSIQQLKDIISINEIEKILRKSYYKDTAYPKCKENWNEDNVTCGQCAITALIVQESIGGTINKININGGETHYFNIINEDVIDLTKEQFKNRNIKIHYYPNEEVKRDEILGNDNTRERYIILKERMEKLRREEYMKDNYFIIHGSFSSPYSNWIGWLHNFIEEDGKQVYVPQFPIGVGYQNYENWSKLLKYYLDLGLINENTTIIGHSIAPVFISKFLTENKVKVKKLIFVCGFNNYLGINEEYDTVNRTMYFDNLEDLKQYTNEIICFYSDNDPYVKYEVEKDFADKIATEQILIPNAGHINSESGYDTFEDIVSYL